MRHNIIFIAVTAFMLTACASSSNVINDDAYYSPYDNNSSYDNTLVTSNNGNFDAGTVKAEKRNNDVETTTIYQDYSSEVLGHKGIEFHDYEILKPGINAAYEIAFGNTSFMINFGCHIGGKDLCEGRVYQKLGMMQHFGKRPLASLTATELRSFNSDDFGFIANNFLPG